jgi:hypothetical protein
MDATGKPDAQFLFAFLIFTTILAAPIALLVSLALLRIYRRAVMRSMQQRVTLGAAPGVLENRPARCGEPPGRPLEIMPHDPPADGVRRAVRRATWPSAAVEVCAGLSYAIVMTSLWIVVTPHHKLGFEHVFQLMVFLYAMFAILWFAWPMVITVGLAIAVSWRGFAMLVVGYALALAGVVAQCLFLPTCPPGRCLASGST